MDLLFIVNKKLAIETVLAQLFIVWALVYLFFLRNKHRTITDFLGKYGIAFAFLISFTATAGSLFYSNVAGYAPCYLCWGQRIFMYPLVIITGLALLKRDRRAVDYILSLAVIGFGISLWHNFIYYYNGGLSVFCDLGAGQVSCVKRYVFELGYVTIPMMALTAFALIITLTIFVKLKDKS